MYNCNRIAFGMLTGGAVGAVALPVHLVFERNWTNESPNVVALFCLYSFGAAGLGVMVGGLIGSVLGGVSAVRWYGPVLGAGTGTLLGVVVNWYAYPGERSYGPFINNPAMNIAVMFSLGGTLVGTIIGIMVGAYRRSRI